MADPKEQRVVAQLVIGGETYDVVPKVQKDTSEVPLQAALNSNERMVRLFNHADRLFGCRDYDLSLAINLTRVLFSGRHVHS